MKNPSVSRFVCAGLCSALTLVAGEAGKVPVVLSVDGGTAEFLAKTNVPAVSVKGKSAFLRGSVAVQAVASGLRLEKIEAWLPVSSLVTGMSVRDEHMRKYIFALPDGQTPDVRFAGQESSCTAGSGSDSTCQVSGQLTIRGVARPFTVPLKVRASGGAFRAEGHGTLKLSDYGIEQPSQFGVKTADEVQLHFDFTARPSAQVMAAAGGRQ